MQKNLTIIIPVYNPTISLDEILSNVYKQKSQNFDVILAIDRPKEIDFITVDELSKKMGSRLKVIFNTSHKHIDIVIKESLELVTTQYIYVLYSYCKLKSEFIQRLDVFLDSFTNKPDFIEMPGFNKSISHSLIKSDILPPLGLIDLEKNKLPFALVTPFVFNCFIKKEIAKTIFDNQKFRDLNLEYSPNFVFRALINSKTFAYFPDTWIENWNNSFSMFNPKSLTRSWNFIFSFVNDDDKELKEALEFSKFMNYCYYVAGILSTYKTKRNSMEWKALENVKLSLINEIKTLKPHWTDLINNNKYFVKFKVINLFNLTDGLLKKWEQIFKKFIW